MKTKSIAAFAIMCILLLGVLSDLVDRHQLRKMQKEQIKLSIKLLKIQLSLSPNAESEGSE